MRKPKKAGMTLLECLLSLTLFALVTSLMARLMAVASNSERAFEAKDRIQEVATSCLYRMALEARSANRWIQPTSGPSDQLIFESPDWQLEDQEFPDPATATPMPTSWSPMQPEFQMRIAYRVESNELIRTLNAESQTWRTPLLKDTVSLQAEWLTPQVIRIELRVRNADGSDHSIEARAVRPEESWVPRP